MAVFKLNEATHDIPYEGYFWYIDDKIVGIQSEVPKYNYQYELKDKTHKNTWSSIAQDYPVNDKVVDWDYYPRGRVMVDPNYNSKGEFLNYSAQVFADKCIDSQEVKDKIIDYYNLYKVDDILWYIGDKYSMMNHYSCHQCRGE